MFITATTLYMYSCLRPFVIGKRRMALLFLLVSLFCSPIPSFAQGMFVNFEAKQTRPIQLSPDQTRLFVVNTPDARLSVFDVVDPSRPVLIAEIPVGIGPVSVNAKTDDEVWVVNEVSDSVSVVSVLGGIVTDTIYVQDEPADVVFANGRAFVSAARKNEVAVFDANTHARLATIPLVGENPRALALSEDGAKLYAAFALSGNRTTLVPFEDAPPPPDPTNLSLPPPPQVGLIVDATDPAWAPSVIKFSMPDNDVVEIDTGTMAVTRYFSRVGTVNQAIAVSPNSGDIYVANTDARNLVRFEPELRGHFVTNRISVISEADGSVTHHDLNPTVDYSILPNLPALSNALAQVTAIAFDASGSSMFAASFGTDRIARIDTNGVVTGFMEVGSTPGTVADPRNKRGPRGLAMGLSQRLYVVNRISNTLSTMDTHNLVELNEVPVGSFDPTPAVIRQGRGFLYDAKLSGNGTVSCASCHVDAEMDMIGWDLGDPGGEMTTVVTEFGGAPTNLTMHPMKGPMTTQTLRGLDGSDPLHWRGDKPDFTHFNGAFDSLMGGSMLSGADMNAYRDFIDTIRFQPNPNQNLDRSLPASFDGGDPIVGRNTYINETGCNACHTLPTGSNGLVIPGAILQETQDFKVPHLRNVYQKVNLDRSSGAVSVGGFGLVHDGEDDGMFMFLSRPVFGSLSTDTLRKQNLGAFVQCLDTGMAPAVGYSRTVTPANVGDGDVVTDWSLLEGQADLGNVDLIGKGTVNGIHCGLVYQPGSTNYLTDRVGMGPFSRTDLEAAVTGGDTVTLMGVPVGSGTRMGVDRNLDGIFDGDVPSPLLAIEEGPDGVVVSWPTNAWSFILEQALDLSELTWEVDRDPRGVSGGQYQVTNSVDVTKMFFRLRGL